MIIWLAHIQKVEIHFKINSIIFIQMENYKFEFYFENKKTISKYLFEKFRFNINDEERIIEKIILKFKI